MQNSIPQNLRMLIPLCCISVRSGVQTKVVKKEIPKAAKIYEKQLMDEINEDREEHGKKPFDGPKPPEDKIVNESTTDPESGVFHKGEHIFCLSFNGAAWNKRYTKSNKLL